MPATDHRPDDTASVADQGRAPETASTRPADEAGLTTAELLGNAALGVLALVVIWAALSQLGVDIVDWIRGQVVG